MTVTGGNIVMQRGNHAGTYLYASCWLSSSSRALQKFSCASGPERNVIRFPKMYMVKQSPHLASARRARAKGSIKNGMAAPTMGKQPHSEYTGGNFLFLFFNAKFRLFNALHNPAAATTEQPATTFQS